MLPTITTEDGTVYDAKDLGDEVQAQLEVLVRAETDYKDLLEAKAEADAEHLYSAQKLQALMLVVKQALGVTVKAELAKKAEAEAEAASATDAEE